MRSRRWIRSKGLLVAALVSATISAFADGKFNEHESSLTLIATKMAKLESEINELIARKRHTSDAEALKPIISEMTAKHLELTKMSEQYVDEKRHIRFKHPEKHDSAERKYTRYRLRSLSEMETEIGLEGKLDRMKKRLTSIYRTEFKKDLPPEQEEQKRKPASDEEPAITEEKLILKK
jgi:hypothetical protein